MLDRIDPDVVAQEALRTAFGQAELPTTITAVLAVRDQLSDTARREHRTARRQLAVSRLGGPSPTALVDRPTGGWGAGRRSVRRAVADGDGAVTGRAWLVLVSAVAVLAVVVTTVLLLDWRADRQEAQRLEEARARKAAVCEELRQKIEEARRTPSGRYVLENSGTELQYLRACS